VIEIPSILLSSSLNSFLTSYWSTWEQWNIAALWPRRGALLAVLIGPQLRPMLQLVTSYSSSSKVEKPLHCQKFLTRTTTKLFSGGHNINKHALVVVHLTPTPTPTSTPTPISGTGTSRRWNRDCGRE